MLEYRFPGYLPSAEDLPDSDETPVDNELQELIPALLKSILLMIWEQRMDWLFAITYGRLRQRYGDLYRSRSAANCPRCVLESGGRTVL
jgi:hypothetical protein